VIRLEWKKVEGKTKDLILFLSTYKGGEISKYALAKELNMARPYLVRLLNKLNDKGIVDSNLKLNRRKIKIKRFSWEIFKQFLGFVTLGVFVSLALAPFFEASAIPFLLGSILVFSFQCVYTFYKIIKEEDVIEVYVRT